MLIAAAVLAGLAFRFWNLGSQPLWLDEAYSAYAAGKGFAFLWQVVPSYETHPPFYYSLLWLWTCIFGDSLRALRALGAVCGIATIAVTVLAGRELAYQTGLDQKRRTRLLAAILLLILVAPMPVQMTREVRPYAVMILVYGTAIAALLRLSRRMAEGQGLTTVSYGVYLLMLALMLWLHNLGALYGIALGLAMLVLCARTSWSRRDWAAFLTGHAAVLLGWLPAIAILADQAPTWVKSTWLTFPPNAFGSRAIMLFVAPTLLSVVAALLLLGLAMARMAHEPQRRRALAALLLLAIAPLMLSITISALVAPVFIPRTMTPLALPALLLLALGFALTHGWMRWAAGAAILIIAAQMASICINRRHAPPPENWYLVVRWLEARIQPEDLVLTYPNEGSLPFDRAVRDLSAEIPSYPVPVPVPAINVGGWYPTGSRGVVSLPRPRLRAIAQSPAVRDARTVWLIRMGPWAYDRGDVFYHELGVGRVQVGHLRTGVIDVAGFRSNRSHRD